MLLDKDKLTGVMNELGDEFPLVELISKYKELNKQSKISRIHDFRHIGEVVEIVTGVSIKTVRSHNRKLNVRYARHLVNYFTYKYTMHSLKSAGECINRDHATVLNSIKKVKEALEGYDEDLRDLHDAVKELLDL
jgi:chromosomal replication initiation ATPase DnaA